MRKNLYILLTDTGSVMTRLIKLYTKDPFNHVSISFDEELKDVFSFGRKKYHNPIIGGFVRENIQGQLFVNAECAVYCLENVDDETYDKIREYVSNFESNKDRYRYNFIGLFGIMFNINIPRYNAYFCSQFVASAFEYSGNALFEKPSNLASARDFESCSKLTPLYVGKLKHYRDFINSAYLRDSKYPLNRKSPA